ncbi:hypothetical protein CEXT_143261 [Caerostris extrusa]|uniref:Uncharacterized protein n=1 Tax=Caerostris extrusa TaxID=172846 RepID=A0AAV4WZ88_CAEEX|nr:hypothetical protein CEXT_143261 [Caerostris extrusa]
MLLQSRSSSEIINIFANTSPIVILRRSVAALVIMCKSQSGILARPRAFSSACFVWSAARRIRSKNDRKGCSSGK